MSNTKVGSTSSGLSPERYYLTVWPPCACDGCAKPGAGWWDCIRIIPGDRKPIARYETDEPASTSQSADVLARHPGQIVVA